MKGLVDNGAVGPRDVQSGSASAGMKERRLPASKDSCRLASSSQTNADEDLQGESAMASLSHTRMVNVLDCPDDKTMGPSLRQEPRQHRQTRSTPLIRRERGAGLQLRTC